MFGLFKKRVAVYPDASQWVVAQGIRGGKPIFVRRNASAASLAGHRDYRFRVGIAVPLKSPNSEGLPSDSEMNELNTIEDGLCERLERERASLHVLSITTQGMREFAFYTRYPSMVTPVIENLQSQVVTHELQRDVGAVVNAGGPPDPMRLISVMSKYGLLPASPSA